jgi:hypothetical protein
MEYSLNSGDVVNVVAYYCESAYSYPFLFA